MQGILEFPPIGCSLDDAPSVIADLFECANELGTKTVLQIGGAALIIRPGENPADAFNRFKNEIEVHGPGASDRCKKDATILWITERRSGDDRRRTLVMACPERRSGDERRLA
jgi:hypothetical protein